MISYLLGLGKIPTELLGACAANWSMQRSRCPDFYGTEQIMHKEIINGYINSTKLTTHHAEYIVM